MTFNQLINRIGVHLSSDEERQMLDVVDTLVADAIVTEWSGWADWQGDCGANCCPACGGLDPDVTDNPEAQVETAKDPGMLGHKAGCRRDRALTMAGFPDAASRDAERARRAKR
jgi:hypothetical protein